jgi:hypothetical protein
MANRDDWMPDDYRPVPAIHSRSHEGIAYYNWWMSQGRRRNQPPPNAVERVLDRELFLSLPEARVVLDQWRVDYNHRRPHGGLKWMTPAAYAAGLDATGSGVVRGPPRGVSPVGAAPLPTTHHADSCSPTLS